MSVPAKTLAPERQCCGDSRRGFGFLRGEVCGVVGKAIGAIVLNAAVVRVGGMAICWSADFGTTIRPRCVRVFSICVVYGEFAVLQFAALKGLVSTQPA